MGPENHVLDGVQIPMGMGKFEGERASHCKVYGHSEVVCSKTAEPIDLPFGLWTRVGRRKRRFNRIRHVVPMCPDRKAH